MAHTVEQLVGVGPRGPGSDGERRAAILLRRVLRDGGRQAQLETVWVRPQWPLAHAWHCALGITGSALAALAPVAGLVVLAVTLASLLLDLGGRGWLARRLTPQRATQNVVSPPRAPGRDYRLVVCANYDAGRTGATHRTRITVPRPFAWLTGALVVLLGCAVARVAGAPAGAMGAVQLVPTIGLVLAVAALLDLALSPASPGAGDNAAGVAVALALVAMLDAAPPERLDVELLLTGAGESPGLGLRAHLRHRRPRLDRRTTIVVGLSACGAGSPVWLSHEGTLLPAATHQQLRAACAGLGARPARSHRLSAFAPARQARLPEITLGARDDQGQIPRSHTPEDTPENVNPSTLKATLELALRLVDALDEELA